MKALLIFFFLFTFIICKGQEKTPKFDHLPKFKKEFYSNNYNMAWYTYITWDVPVSYTLAMAAQKTNYGRNGRYRVGDIFGTGKTYEFTNAWDEFGLMMKTTHNFIKHTRTEGISIGKKTEEMGIDCNCHIHNFSN